MSSVLNRTTKEFRRSANTPDFPVVDWIINPDMSAVAGYEPKYWTISGDSVLLKSSGERDTVDADEAAAAVAADRVYQKTRMDNRIEQAMAVFIASEMNKLKAGTYVNLTAATVTSGIKAEVDNV